SVPASSASRAANVIVRTVVPIGLKHWKCSSAKSHRREDHVRYSTRSEVLASTACQSEVVLPDPGYPRKTRTGEEDRTESRWRSVQGSVKSEPPVRSRGVRVW